MCLASWRAVGQEPSLSRALSPVKVIPPFCGFAPLPTSWLTHNGYGTLGTKKPRPTQPLSKQAIASRLTSNR
jgi:hypothetical protein